MKRFLSSALFVVFLLGFVIPAAAQDPAAIVANERAKYFAPLSASDAVKLLRAVAAELNAAGFPGGPFGILVKTTGANCGGYSCDIICSGQGSEQRQWDVLIDSERPAWQPVDGIAVRPCEIVPAGGGTVPGGGDTDALKAKIGQLEGQLASSQVRISDLERELAAAKQGGGSSSEQLALLHLILEAIAQVPQHQIPADVGGKIQELTAAVQQERIVTFKLLGQNVTAVIKEGK